MNARRLFPLFALAFLLGCVSASHNYTPPSVSLLTAPNSKVVDKSKEEVWNELVQGLSGQFFVINNMDKSSGFINVSYSGDPERYVDGGELYFKVSNLAGTREYKFPAASANEHYEEIEKGMLLGIDRQLNLEGRMNVVVSEIAPSKTRVTVHTRYILTLNGSFQSVTGQSGVIPTQTITFDTGGEGRTTAGIVFRSTGKLEDTALGLVE
jgi:hypothetical protein